MFVDARHLHSAHLAVDCAVEKTRREEERRLAQARQQVVDQLLAESQQQRVRLNVGGQVFEATRPFLLEHKTSVLAQLVAAAPANNGVIELFVNRDPKAFGYVLGWLRSGAVPDDPSAYDMETLIREAKFWALDELVLKLNGGVASDLPRITQKKLVQYMAVSKGKGVVLPSCNLASKTTPERCFPVQIFSIFRIILCIRVFVRCSFLQILSVWRHDEIGEFEFRQSAIRRPSQCCVDWR